MKCSSDVRAHWVTSRGLWPSVAVPSLASPKFCFTMHNLAPSRTGVKRCVYSYSLLSYLLNSSKEERSGNSRKSSLKMCKIELGAKSIGGRRVSSKMGRHLSGKARSERTQGVRRRLVFPFFNLKRLGRAAQLPLHMGVGGVFWQSTVALHSGA